MGGVVLDLKELKVKEGTDSLPTIPSEIVLNERKNILKQVCQEYIERHYPAWKQRSDAADREYWGTLLIELGHTADEIYKTARNAAKKVLDEGATLESVLPLVTGDELTAWTQVIKSAVRVGWLQKVKEVYRKELEGLSGEGGWSPRSVNWPAPPEGVME